MKPSDPNTSSSNGPTPGEKQVASAGGIRTPAMLAYQICFGILLLACCVISLAYFVHTPGIDGLHLATLHDQIFLNAYRPYVFRVLTPLVVQGSVRAVAPWLRPPLAVWVAEDKAFREDLCVLGWEPAWLVEYFVAIAWMLVALIVFGVLLRKFLALGWGATPIWFRDLWVLLAILTLPLHFAKYYCYLYDFPTLALFTLGLLFLWQRRWLPYAILFPLLCLNKETTILLTLLFGLHYGFRRLLPKRLFWSLFSYQLTVFMTIKLGLNWWFRGQPGEVVEFHLFDHNLGLMFTHTHLFYQFFGRLIIFAIFVPYAWQTKPAFLRDAFWLVIPLVGLMFLFGFLDEMRAALEFYPIAVALIGHAVIQRFRPAWLKPAGAVSASESAF